jgi:DNA-binding response OmpR family regulator
MKKILIIDDDILIRETVGLSLAGEGYAVSSLDGGEKAVEQVKAQKPDLVILDLYMPDVSGFDVCRALKADEATKRVPIVIFTGSNETIDVMSGIDAGAFEYITKPIDGRQLLKKIKKMLDAR